MELVSCNMLEDNPFSCCSWQMHESVSDNMTMQSFKQCSYSSHRMYIICQSCVLSFYAVRHSSLEIEDLVLWTVWRLNLHIGMQAWAYGSSALKEKPTAWRCCSNLMPNTTLGVCNVGEDNSSLGAKWQMLESVSENMTMEAFKQCSCSSHHMYLTCRLCVFRFYAATHSSLKIEDLVVSVHSNRMEVESTHLECKFEPLVHLP
jgi:hypothetical protein